MSEYVRFGVVTMWREKFGWVVWCSDGGWLGGVGGGWGWGWGGGGGWGGVTSRSIIPFLDWYNYPRGLVIQHSATIELSST